VIQLTGFPTAAFPGSHAALDPELDAMLVSALMQGETIYLRVQSAPGEALVLTQVRVIVLKSANLSATGRAFGRYFSLDEIMRFEYRGWLRTSFIAVVTRATQQERIPNWGRWRCTFGTIFTGSLGTLTARYLRDLEGWLAVQRRAALLHGVLPVVTPVGVALQGSEHFYIQVPVVYYEEKSIRQYSGGSAGVSVPVMRGIRLRIGKSRGVSWTKQVLQQDDSGSLLIGTLRVVFVGSRRTLSIPLASIVTVEAFADGMHVGVANKPMIVFRTEDDLPGLLLKRLLGIP
jgi:hypothetical protein